MPTATEQKVLDEKTLRQAVEWAIKYYLDPNRGAGKRLPSLKELQAVYPQIISIDQIENWLRNISGEKDVNKILEDDQKTKGVLERLEGAQQESKPEVHTAPSQIESVKYPSPKGKVSGLGVLAELEIIEPLLAKHRQEASQKLSADLRETIKTLLPEIGVKNLKGGQLDQISAEVAQETARQALEDVVKIQSPNDTLIIVSDSLTQSLITHPEVAPEIKSTEEKVFETVAERTQGVVSKNQPDLEKAAVLGALVEINQLGKPNQKMLEEIAENAQRTVEGQAPLASLAAQEQIKTSMKDYLASYSQALIQKLPNISEGSIPSFEELQKAKDAAHNIATARVGSILSQTAAGKQLTQKLPYQQVTSNFASSIGLIKPAPSPAPQIYKLPTGSGLILSSPSRVNEAYFSLLAFDQEKLAKALRETSAEIEKYKNKKSLSYKERKSYFEAQRRYTRYTGAQAFQIKKAKKAQAYRTLFSQAFGGRVDVASQQAWFAENQLLKFSPNIIAYNERLAAGAAFGKLGFSFGGANIGSIFSKIRGQMSATSMIGMGIARTNPALGIAKKVRNIAGATFGGLALYFLGLGQAAAAGFIAGAAIGGTAGAVAGAVIPVAALGPAGVLLWPVTVPLGAFAFGIVGGVAGGLIALGVASGSATAISMGVGTGIGGVIGGYVGFVVGSAVSGAFIAFAAAACAATGIGCLLVPIAAVSAPVIIITFTAIGALIGGAIGAAIGYVIGNYVIKPAVSAFNSATSGITQGIGAGAGVLGSIGNFITGTASALWGGISSIGGGALGFLSGAANSLLGLASVSTASAASLPALSIVAGTVTTVGTLGTIAGIVTATTFFSIASEDDTSQTIPGQNEFFTLTKTSNASHLDNPPPDREVTFTVSLTAKDLNLDNVSVTDEINVKGKDTPFEVTTDKDGNPISPGPCPAAIPAGGNCTFSYTINVDDKFKDSIIANTATVKATPEGKAEITDSASTTVTVGSPPAQCPRGWPAIGDVTQGPEGATSHGPGGYEALDIGQGSIGGIGKPVYATVEGTVVESFINAGNNLDQRIGVEPTACSGLEIVYYWHLSSRNVGVGEIVTFGQVIGATGQAGTGPHIHYQFNRSFNRNFEIAPPYIPKSVPRTCDSPEACNVKITSAP